MGSILCLRKLHSLIVVLLSRYNNSQKSPLKMHCNKIVFFLQKQVFINSKSIYPEFSFFPIGILKILEKNTIQKTFFDYLKKSL